MPRPTVPSPIFSCSAISQSGVSQSTADSSTGPPENLPTSSPLRSPASSSASSSASSPTMLATTPPMSFSSGSPSESPSGSPSGSFTGSRTSSPTTCDVSAISRASIPQPTESPIVNGAKYKEQPRWDQRIDIHNDGRFMSALRAMQDSDLHQPIVSRRRTNSNTNITDESACDRSIAPSTPDKISPSAAKRRPRRKLQRSQAFMIDRSPSPSGRIYEIKTDGAPEEDELCALFNSTCGGFDQD